MPLYSQKLVWVLETEAPASSSYVCMQHYIVTHGHATAELANASTLESTTPLWMRNRFWVMPPIQYVTSNDNQISKHSLKQNTVPSTSSSGQFKLYTWTGHLSWCMHTTKFLFLKRSETFFDPRPGMFNFFKVSWSKERSQELMRNLWQWIYMICYEFTLQPRILVIKQGSQQLIK